MTKESNILKNIKTIIKTRENNKNSLILKYLIEILE